MEEVLNPPVCATKRMAEEELSSHGTTPNERPDLTTGVDHDPPASTTMGDIFLRGGGARSGVGGGAEVGGGSRGRNTGRIPKWNV